MNMPQLPDGFPDRSEQLLALATQSADEERIIRAVESSIYWRSQAMAAMICGKLIVVTKNSDVDEFTFDGPLNRLNPHASGAGFPFYKPVYSSEGKVIGLQKTAASYSYQDPSLLGDYRKVPVLAGPVVGVGSSTMASSIIMEDRTHKTFALPATRDAAFDAVPPDRLAEIETYLERPHLPRIFNRLVRVSLVDPDGQPLVTIGEIGDQATES
ncbi:MAG: hypothetical protein ACM3JF_00425 [Sphaerimonospora mesophila]